MVSVNYNPAAATAVRVLQSTNRDIETTQRRLATGLKVASASDNATVWAASEGLKTEIKEKAVIRDALASFGSKAKVASVGLESASSILSDMKTLLLKAKDPSATAATKADVQKGLAELQNQLKSVVSEAQVGGESWLNGTKASASVVTSYGSSATTMSVDLSASNLLQPASGATPAAGILDKAGTASSTAVLSFDVTAGGANVDNMLTDLETAATAVKAAAATVGAAASRTQTHDDFLKKISSFLEDALGDMVNTDMEEETAKLAALQVRQQLATQMLSMANDSTRNILLLFRQ